jgi:hypothetical protein
MSSVVLFLLTGTVGSWFVLSNGEEHGARLLGSEGRRDYNPNLKQTLTALLDAVMLRGRHYLGACWVRVVCCLVLSSIEWCGMGAHKCLVDDR